MPKLRAVGHAELVAKLRKAGFEGPFSGGKHLFMSCCGATSGLPYQIHTAEIFRSHCFSASFDRQALSATSGLACREPRVRVC